MSKNLGTRTWLDKMIEEWWNSNGKETATLSRCSICFLSRFISNNAEFGDITRGPRIVTDETKREMKKILSEIQSGQYAREFILEKQSGNPGFTAIRRREAEHQIESVGKDLRAMFSWLKKA